MKSLYERYEGYRKPVQEHMKAIIENIKDKYKCVPDVFLVELDILAINLDIMYHAKEEMDEKGFQHEDHQKVQRKAGWVQQFNTSQMAVMRILHDFALNPMSQSKMKEVKEQKDIQKIIDAFSE